MSNLGRALGFGSNPRTLAHFWYIQTASYATAIPIVYGQNRVAASMIHMPVQPGLVINVPLIGQVHVVSGGGKSQKSSQTYQAPVILAICEGPITGVNFIWVDKGQPEIYSSGWIINQANENANVPAVGPYTITVAFTTGGLGWYSDVSVYDATSNVFLTRIPDNASPSPAAGQYQLDGTGNGKYYFNAAQASHSVWITWFYHSQGTDFPGSWTLKLGTTPAQAVWSGLAAYPGQGVMYPGVAYFAHPNANFPNDTAQQLSFEVEGLVQAGGGIVDANGADILTDFLTNALHGANFPAASLGNLVTGNGSYKTYCGAAGLFSSPVYQQTQAAHQHLQELFEVTNSAPYWSDGLLKVVPYGDTAITANGFAYVPNTTPLYALTDVDFLPNRAVHAGAGTSGHDDRGAELDPVLIVRKDPTLIPNRVKIDYVNRLFDYNADFVVAEDLVSETLNGPLELGALSLRSVTTPSVARMVAQLRLQREQLIMPITYQFVVGWKYSALEPMDLIELSDANLGLAATPVRITAVEELPDEGGFAVTAEPWPLGVASAVLYGAQSGAGTRAAVNVLPGSTSAPCVIEGPAQLISSAMELWIGASGGANWGGCQVWFSVDNVNFQQVGQITGPAAYGTMQPSGVATSASQYPTVDSVNTATVTATSGRQLVSLSATDFAHLTYPVVLTDGTTPEWTEYEVAALVSGTEYNLSTLYRGLYGTAPRAHLATDVFMLIDQAVAKIPWPNGVQGSTLYVKLPAFNVYGKQLEDLSTISSFSYVIGGIPIARVSAVPTMVLTIATNDSLTVATAKASMKVTVPPNGVLIKYLASTSAQPTVASVISGGTVVSSGAPFFLVADLGVNLNFGDTVYATAVYYDQLGNALTAVQGHATRPSILASKTLVIPGTGFLPGLSAGMHGTYLLDTANGYLVLNSALSAVQTDTLTVPVVMPQGATITRVQAQLYSGPGTLGTIDTSLFRNASGTITNLGTMHSGAGGGNSTAVLSGLSENTNGNTYYMNAIFTGSASTTAGTLRYLTVVVFYTIPNPAVTI